MTSCPKCNRPIDLKRVSLDEQTALVCLPCGAVFRLTLTPSLLPLSVTTPEPKAQAEPKSRPEPGSKLKPDEALPARPAVSAPPPPESLYGADDYIERHQISAELAPKLRRHLQSELSDPVGERTIVAPDPNLRREVR